MCAAVCGTHACIVVALARLGPAWQALAPLHARHRERATVLKAGDFSGRVQ